MIRVRAWADIEIPVDPAESFQEDGRESNAGGEAGALAPRASPELEVWEAGGSLTNL